MNETTPKYIKNLEINLKSHIDSSIKSHIDIAIPKYIKESEINLKNYINSSINELAVMIKDNFATKDEWNTWQKIKTNYKYKISINDYKNITKNHNDSVDNPFIIIKPSLWQRFKNWIKGT